MRCTTSTEHDQASHGALAAGPGAPLPWTHAPSTDSAESRTFAWVRDVTFVEDLCQIRTGAMRNLVISLHRLAGATNIATVPAGTKERVDRSRPAGPPCVRRRAAGSEVGGVLRPQGNAVVLAVLRSPAHRLLSGVAVELRYTGRRSGRPYVLPVQYAREGSRLVVVPQHPSSTTWWRNFRTPQPVTVRLSGRLREGTARVVERADPAWEEDRRVYGSRWRRFADRLDGPLVEIALDP